MVGSPTQQVGSCIAVVVIIVFTIELIEDVSLVVEVDAVEVELSVGPQVQVI